MEFDTFYQYFIYSKNWAYISIILILPTFALIWNTIIYPTKDIKNAPQMEARFLTPQFDENKLEIEVALDGKKTKLGYKLK